MMLIPVELIQLVGTIIMAGGSFALGIAWGRKYPNKVEKMAEELANLKANLKK